VSDFVWFTFSAGGLVCGLVAGSACLCARPHAAWPRRLLVALGIFYGLASNYGFGYAVGQPLLLGLRPFEAADVPAGRRAIVVLGSGSLTVRDWNDDPFSIVDPPAASRVVEAVRVFKLTNPDWVISSGGLARPDPTNRQVPSGITMRDALVRMGVPAERILVETQSRTTHTEALVVEPMLRSLGVEHTVLVTSAGHMRRSLGTFRAVGRERHPGHRAAPRPRSVVAPLAPSERGRSARDQRGRSRDTRPRLLHRTRAVSLLRRMIAHVVLLQPRSDLSASDRRSFAAALTRAVREIPTVRGVRIGRRVGHGAGYERGGPVAADIIAILEFEDVDALQAYLRHPAHEALADWFKRGVSSALVYDFETGGLEILDDLM
jgi:uncharacterized SAM-binding protein YcdF (DUF218 family)